MKYFFEKQSNLVWVSVEASFTLIDFIMMTVSFLVGSFFMMIFYLFTGAIILKIFVRYEYHFDLDKYEIRQYLRFFNFLKIRVRTIPFGEVSRILLSNYESGNVLMGKGMGVQEWFTLDINTGNSVVRMVKAEPDELEELYDLYQDLEDKLDLYFTFKMEFMEVGEE